MNWIRAGAFIALPLALAACDSHDKSQDIVTAKGFTVTQSELDQMMAQAGPMSQGAAGPLRDQVLEALINEKAAAAAAGKEGLDRDPRVMRAIENAKRTILARAYAEKLTGTIAEPSEDEARKYCNDHPEMFRDRVQVQAIQMALVGDRNAAVKIRDRLAAGEQPAAVQPEAAKAGITVQARGVTLTSDQMPSQLAQRMDKASAGAAVPFDGPAGPMLFKVQSITPQPVAIEQAVPGIRKSLQMQRKNEAVANAVKKLRDDAGVTMHDEGLAAALKGK